MPTPTQGCASTIAQKCGQRSFIRHWKVSSSMGWVMVRKRWMFGPVSMLGRTAMPTARAANTQGARRDNRRRPVPRRIACQSSIAVPRQTAIRAPREPQ